MEWVADNSGLLEKSTIVQGKRERKLSNKIKWYMEEGVKTPPIPGCCRCCYSSTLNVSKLIYCRCQCVVFRPVAFSSSRQVGRLFLFLVKQQQQQQQQGGPFGSSDSDDSDDVETAGSFQVCAGFVEETAFRRLTRRFRSRAQRRGGAGKIQSKGGKLW